MVKKDRSAIVNKTYLMKMLPLLYQNHLKNQLEESQLIFLNLLIKILQEIKQVSIEKIATALPIPILFNSRRKKIQRFLSLPTWNIQSIWFPIIQAWLSQNFDQDQPIYLAIDRTSWKQKNLLMISIIYDKRAIPVYFELLPKLGASSFAEQTKAFSQVLELFNSYRTVVLGDREFCSVKLANWLREQDVEFCLRLKKNEFIKFSNNVWCQLDDLGLKPGISFFIENVKVTKNKNLKFRGFNIAGKWQKKYKGSTTPEGWFILTNMSSSLSAIQAYKQRFNIEEMFRDFKSGGYNLEETNVEGLRFISLVLILSFAYCYATFSGKIIKQKGLQKYINRVKEYGRIPRRHSSFYIGLYGQTWVKFRDDCWDLVQDLMRLSLHKLEHYLRGIRAMNLIQSCF
jgi:hypothetical protein